MKKVLSIIFNTIVYGNFVKTKALPFKKVILSIRKTIELIYRSLHKNVAFSLTLIFLRVHIEVCRTP